MRTTARRHRGQSSLVSRASSSSSGLRLEESRRHAAAPCERCGAGARAAAGLGVGRTSLFGYLEKRVTFRAKKNRTDPTRVAFRVPSLRGAAATAAASRHVHPRAFTLSPCSRRRAPAACRPPPRRAGGSRRRTISRPRLPRPSWTRTSRRRWSSPSNAKPRTRRRPGDSRSGSRRRSARCSSFGSRRSRPRTTTPRSATWRGASPRTYTRITKTRRCPPCARWTSPPPSRSPPPRRRRRSCRTTRGKEDTRGIKTRTASATPSDETRRRSCFSSRAFSARSPRAAGRARSPTPQRRRSATRATRIFSLFFSAAARSVGSGGGAFRRADVFRDRPLAGTHGPRSQGAAATRVQAQAGVMRVFRERGERGERCERTARMMREEKRLISFAIALLSTHGPARSRSIAAETFPMHCCNTRMFCASSKKPMSFICAS